MHLRFADDVALTTESVKDMERQLNTMNEENLKLGLVIPKGKPKCMTSIDATNSVQIDGTEIEEKTNYQYLAQTMATENKTRQEVSIRTKARWNVLGKYRKTFCTGTFP